jgi:hypothetical protein
MQGSCPLDRRRSWGHRVIGRGDTASLVFRSGTSGTCFGASEASSRSGSPGRIGLRRPVGRTGVQLAFASPPLRGNRSEWPYQRQLSRRTLRNWKPGASCAASQIVSGSRTRESWRCNRQQGRAPGSVDPFRYIKTPAFSDPSCLAQEAGWPTVAADRTGCAGNR